MRHHWNPIVRTWETPCGIGPHVKVFTSLAEAKKFEPEETDFNNRIVAGSSRVIILMEQTKE